MQDLLSKIWTNTSKNPDKKVLNFLDGSTLNSLNYKELDEKSARVAALLKDLNIQSADRVIIALPQSLSYLTAFLGCLYAGIIAVPVYPPARGNQANRLRHIVLDSQAKAIIADIATIDTLKTLEADPIFSQIKYLDINIAQNVDEPMLSRNRPDPNSIAFLQYTSGSVGNPKGVIVKHENLSVNFEMMRVGMEADEESVMVSWLPLFHDMGLIGNALLPIYLSASLYLMSPIKFIKKPLAWLEAISNYRGTHGFAPNFAYDMCVASADSMRLENLDLSSWKMALNGAEPVRLKTLQKFIESFSRYHFNPQAIYPAYGMAEATLYVAGGKILSGIKYESLDSNELKMNRAVIAENSHDNGNQKVNCGKPWLDESIIIVDQLSKQRLSSRMIGEIWIKGKTVCEGYWQKPEINEEIFNAYTSDTKEGPFLRTGDTGYLDEAGELYIVGRLKDLIIIRGKNFAPNDIEITVESSSSLLISNASIAFSIDHEQEEKLVIVAAIREELNPDEYQDLVKLINKNILVEHQIVPHEVVLVDRRSIPKTTSGKLQRQVCKANYLNDQLKLMLQSQYDNC